MLMTGAYSLERSDDAAGMDGAVVAPGYQAELFRTPAYARPRWRAVRRDGTRLPPVAQLGVVAAQASAIAVREGAAWIVGTDHHAAQIAADADGWLRVSSDGAPPRGVAALPAPPARTRT